MNDDSNKPIQAQGDVGSDTNKIPGISFFRQLKLVKLSSLKSVLLKPKVLAPVVVVVALLVAGGIYLAQRSSPPTQTDLIKANWATFFNGNTPASQKINLLQNGQQFTKQINTVSKSAISKVTTAKVLSVTINGNKAAVLYELYSGGKPAAANQQGQAVKINGTWKVGYGAYCAFLQPFGTVLPKICPAVTH